jgi:hypothetical protein
MKSKHGTISVPMAALLAALLAAASCGSHPQNSTTAPSTQATAAKAAQNGIVPYIPPMYYACSETTPQNLAQAYFLRYFNVADAENNFNGQVFVFKNITISEYSLKYATDDSIWVDSIIQCYFLKSGGAKDLKAGETVDVVGIDAGMGKDYTGTLIFKDCIFLPAGSIQLPAAGTSGPAVPFY